MSLYTTTIYIRKENVQINSELQANSLLRGECQILHPEAYVKRKEAINLEGEKGGGLGEGEGRGRGQQSQEVNTRKGHGHVKKKK